MIDRIERKKERETDRKTEQDFKDDFELALAKLDWKKDYFIWIVFFCFF